MTVSICVYCTAYMGADALLNEWCGGAGREKYFLFPLNLDVKYQLANNKDTL